MVGVGFGDIRSFMRPKRGSRDLRSSCQLFRSFVVCSIVSIMSRSLRSGVGRRFVEAPDAVYRPHGLLRAAGLQLLGPIILQV